MIMENQYQKLPLEQQEQFKESILKYGQAQAGKSQLQKTVDLLNPMGATQELLRSDANILRPKVNGTPIASVSKRVGATLIDFSISALTFGVLLVVNLILSAYGGTIGKRALGLATVNADTGKNIGLFRAIERAVLMVLAIVPLRGWLFFTLSSHQAQKMANGDDNPSLFIYDRWTHTAVIDKKIAAAK